MSERFYTPVSLVGARIATLDESEGRHLVQVLRKKAGDEVVLFDGMGTEADACVESASKKGATLRVLATRTTDAGKPPRLIVATAVPKGDRFRWLVEKATELGVDRLVPLGTERSVVDPRETKLDRMRAAVIEACKQCRRNRLMEIAATQTVDGFLGSIGAVPALAVADREGRPAGEWLASTDSERPVAVLIGPEGGLTEGELEAARRRGAATISLGPHILRIETAVLAISALAALRSDRSPG